MGGSASVWSPIVALRNIWRRKMSASNNICHNLYISWVILKMATWQGSRRRRSHFGDDPGYCPPTILPIIPKYSSLIITIVITVFAINNSHFDDDDIDTNDSPAFLLKPITRNVSTISSPESPFSSPSSPVQCDDNIRLDHKLTFVDGRSWMT